MTPRQIMQLRRAGTGPAWRSPPPVADPGITGPAGRSGDQPSARWNDAIPAGSLTRTCNTISASPLHCYLGFRHGSGEEGRQTGRGAGQEYGTTVIAPIEYDGCSARHSRRLAIWASSDPLCRGPGAREVSCQTLPRLHSAYTCRFSPLLHNSAETRLAGSATT